MRCIARRRARRGGGLGVQRDVIGPARRHARVTLTRRTSRTRTARSVPLTGRLTLKLVDSQNVALPFAYVGTLGVHARSGTHGADIPGTGVSVNAIAEVQEAGSATWTPYLDYYDAAPTSMTGSGTSVLVRRSFYDK